VLDVGKIGISERYVRIVKSKYVYTQVKDRLGAVETDWVKSVRGV
jgi:hypothetical protein